MMAGVNPHFTVANTIFDCGVTNVALFNGTSKSNRIAAELFYDELLSCIENTYEEFGEDLKSYSNLKFVNGQIRLGTGQNKNTKAFIQ